MKSTYKFSAIAASLILMSAGAFAQLPANATLYASGLNGPRGLKFGPDGLLYIAEAGTGGTASTGTACAQVVALIGPYTGGTTARISRVDRSGHLSTVASGFPSSIDSQGDIMGVADLAFVNNQLYALLAGQPLSYQSHLVPHHDAYPRNVVPAHSRSRSG
jgi:hypothetical protein